MATYNSVLASSRSVLVPTIPELQDAKFLDVLIPVKAIDNESMDVDIAAAPGPSNPMIDALKATTRQTLTANMAPAYTSTDSSTLNAFTGLSRYTYGFDVTSHLEGSWKENPDLTLRIIWNLRSIHDGKGEKEAFYRAFGWLYDNHPRTAISNLHLLVEPVCDPPKKKKLPLAHGYWKDLLNILALATVDELSNISGPAKFLHTERSPYTYPRSKPRTATGTAESRIEAAKVANAENKVASAAIRELKNAQNHEQLVRKLAEPKFRALFIAVARLFSDQLLKDIKVLGEINALEPGQDPVPLFKKISLAGKWAPTPGGSHDRVTNIATVISELIYASKEIPMPSIIDSPISEQERAHTLRSFYQRWILTELRRASLCPEPLMSANRWSEIRYNRVASICMKNNTESFFKHDTTRFEAYLTSVENGKKDISGATLLPHELVGRAVEYSELVTGKSGFSYEGEEDDNPRQKRPSPTQVFKKRLAETQMRVIDAQWKTLIESLRESGSIDNAIAICDVSGSMGYLGGKYNSKHVSPIYASVGLSLVLASLAKPPFNSGAITFSERPQYITIDTSQPLRKQIDNLQTADWGMNTNLSAVFLDLLLPLAVSNNIKQEDMIKRLFIFSDMQFDEGCNTNASPEKWVTNYDAIERAYKEAGYEVPQIVYWDLAASRQKKTVDVEESTRKGVAMMNGFSSAMLKVFMGEEEMKGDEWEQVGEDGESVTVVEKEDEFNPVNVMKKALMKKSFDGLVVVD